jgi:hypothetical protein
MAFIDCIAMAFGGSKRASIDDNIVPKEQEHISGPAERKEDIVALSSVYQCYITNICITELKSTSTT